MKQYWSPEKVKNVISEYLKNKQGESEINFIVTFDEFGISYHPNHIAVHKGVSLIFEEGHFLFDVLCLKTVSTFRKYLGYVDIYTVMPDTLNYFCLTPLNAFSALSVHKSQFVWFRKLFSIFSRYAYLNTLDHYT